MSYTYEVCTIFLDPKSMMTCEWCGRKGLHSIYPGIVNGERRIRICTKCANEHPRINEQYVAFTETGIEREEREASFARS